MLNTLSPPSPLLTLLPKLLLIVIIIFVISYAKTYTKYKNHHLHNNNHIITVRKGRRTSHFTALSVLLRLKISKSNFLSVMLLPMHKSQTFIIFLCITIMQAIGQTDLKAWFCYAFFSFHSIHFSFWLVRLATIAIK